MNTDTELKQVRITADGSCLGNGTATTPSRRARPSSASANIHAPSPTT